jgi:hypothetical protein
LLSWQETPSSLLTLSLLLMLCTAAQFQHLMHMRHMWGFNHVVAGPTQAGAAHLALAGPQAPEPARETRGLLQLLQTAQQRLEAQ